jgi:hypothetical protein
LVQQVAMLRRGGDARFKAITPFAEALVNRRELDRFGTGSED